MVTKVLGSLILLLLWYSSAAAWRHGASFWSDAGVLALSVDVAAVNFRVTTVTHYVTNLRMLRNIWYLF